MKIIFLINKTCQRFQELLEYRYPERQTFLVPYLRCRISKRAEVLCGNIADRLLLYGAQDNKQTKTTHIKLYCILHEFLAFKELT
jgi:hypothetical protein